MASLLVGVTATDPATFAAMAVMFTLIAAFAAWIPARRAAALNPNACSTRRMTTISDLGSRISDQLPIAECRIQKCRSIRKSTIDPQSEI